MRAFRSVLLVVLLASVALAGCSGDADVQEGGFKVTAPDDPATEPFTFRAASAADTYRWDFGDGTALGEGREVEHTYGAATGEVIVTLRATKDGEEKDHTKTVVLGEGDNARPDLRLQISTDWAVVGENVRISGAASSDPEGDAILVSFHCIFQGELALAGADHDHGGGGGVPFVGPTVSKFPSEVVRDLPAADRQVEGDLCENVRGDGHFSSGLSVEGAFTEPGLYRILMLGRDPVHASVSGFYDLVVSEPEERPEPIFTEAFEGTFQGGVDGSGQALCEQAQPGTVCDRTVHSFKLALPAERLWVNLTHDDGTGGAVQWALFKGNKAVGEGTQSTEFEDPETFTGGDYRIELTLEHGLQVGYELEIAAQYNMDPAGKYETEH